MSSTKQLEANRANSSKSTGPKTDKGKTIVAKNALKHGLLSEEVVLDSKDIGESKEDFDELKNMFITDLKPNGILEELLVDRIVTTYWRLRRVIWSENGTILKQTNNLWLRKMMTRVKQADKYDELPTLVRFKERLENSISASRANAKLVDFRRMVEKEGYFSDEVLKSYQTLTNLINNEENFSWFIFLNEIAKGKVEGENKEKGKKALLFLLEEEIKASAISVDVANDMEESETEAENLSLRIPGNEMVEKLGRYETSLENQLYKAVNQLLKIQTLRKGGRVFSANITELESIES